MNLKPILLAAAVAASCLFLGGCGGSGDEAGNATNTPSAGTGAGGTAPSAPGGRPGTTPTASPGALPPPPGWTGGGK